MAHDHHRHDHDKGLMAKLHWLFLIGHFWMSDVNRAVVDLADPKPGERGLDVGAGMGPATGRSSATPDSTVIRALAR